MAYGVKWFSYFSDLQNAGLGNYLLEVLERDYAGGSTRVLSGGDPARVKMADVTDAFDPIRSMEFNFEWNAQEGVSFEINELFITDDLKYRFRLSKLDAEDNPTVLYYGYLVPIKCEQPFLPKPYPVTFSATCGLPLLRDVYYLDAFGAFVEGKVSIIKIIANCLASTGHSLPIHTYVNLFEQGMSIGSGSPWALAQIDADGLRGMKAMEVLEGILRSFRAFIVQAGGVWVIKRVKEQISHNNRVFKFNSNGDSTGSETVSQAASFGKTIVLGAVPQVKPVRKSVKQSLAVQNSIVRNTVRAGIAVNRLPNGTFSGVVSGGNLTGWIVDMAALQHPSGPGWTRAGAGMPENPYRFEITGADTYGSSGHPSNIHVPDPIIINAGNFDPDRETKIKIIFSGAYRAADISWFKLFVRINDGDRKFVSYLDENGKWNLSKKEEFYCQIDVDVPANPPNSLDFSEATLQTFEITSDEVTNYLNQSGIAIAKLYFEVRAGFVTTDKTKFHFLNPKLSWEDFAVCVTTETIFEGEHTYQVDAKFPIRNPNSAEYSTIVADKIGIETPEQSRDVNRVLTGYMTLLDGTLTQAWKGFVNGFEDPTDSAYEPLQKKSLRETVRLLCGKRRVFDGIFMGYGIRPDHSVFNAYDEPEDPETFFAITAYEWDIKKMEYTMTLNELRFDPLDEEVIDIVGDEDGRRGNRLYAGAGGSKQSNSGGSQNQIEEIVLDDIPTVYFTVGVQEIKVVDLAALIESSHTPESLLAIPEHYTDWVSHVGIDRGDDGDELTVLITAKPAAPGTDRVLVELIGPDGEDYMAVINLVAVPATKFKHVLRDRTGGGVVILGEIKPGSGFMKPDAFDIVTTVKGFHEGFFQAVSGPGVAESTDSPYVEVDATDEASYIIPEMPATGDVGTYGYTFGTYRNEGDPDLFGLVKLENLNFVLYDEAYLAKAKFEIWIGGTKFGDIDPDGSSAFNTEGQAFQIKIIVDDVEHDEASAVLSYEGTENHSNSWSHDPSVSDITYDLYDVLPSPQGEGYYELNLLLNEEGGLAYDRTIGFTVNEKKEEPEGGEMFLASMRDGQSAYDIMGTLSLSGNLFSLPASGWNAGTLAPVVAGTRRSHVLLQKRGSLVAVNTALYTGRPQYRDYTEDLDEAEYLIFDGLSSKDIDKIHANNTSFRLIITDEVAGVVEAIYQGDFSFGTLEDLTGLDIEEPGSKTILPGRAMKSNPISSNVEAFDWVPDDETLEVFEGESPNDPDAAPVNYSRIKDKGVTYAKFQDMPARTVLGNMTDANGTPTSVTVAEVLEDAELNDLVSPQAIINYVTGQIQNSITGTINFVPVYATIHTFADSIIRQIAGKIGVGINPTEALHVAGSVLATMQVIAEVATGTAPLLVNSVTLVVNLNSDLLDGEHGPFYLDWDNFSNYKSVIAGNGTTGGGPLSSDVTINIGTPQSITSSSANSVSDDSHTHEIESIDWEIIENTPTTIGDYGITDAYTQTETNDLLDDKSDIGHTHPHTDITDFETAGRALISGTGVISYNSGTGVISYTGSSGTVDGSGTKNKLPKWDVPGTGLLDSRVYDEGTGPVEVLASLQVSGGIKASSTSEGFIKPRMTYAQRHAIAAPTVGETVFQTDTVGSAVTGEYTYFPSGWYPTLYGSTAL